MITIRELPELNVCDTPTEWTDEDLNVSGVRPCMIPTRRAVYDDVTDLHPDDPARWHTVHPVCELHEISLYLRELADGN